MPLNAPGGDSPAWRRRLQPVLSLPTPVIFMAAAALAAFLLWRQGSLQGVGVALRRAEPWQVGAILLAYATSVFVLGMRWHALVRMVGGAAPWTAASEVFLTSVIVNYAAPIGLAVPTRAALTVRDLELPLKQSGAVVAWEAALDVAALTVISTVWLAYGGVAALPSASINASVVWIVVVGVLVAILLAVVGVRSTAIGSRLLAASRTMLAYPSGEPGAGLAALALTVVFWATQIGVMALLLVVFGGAPGARLLLGLMGLPVLIGMLSPVPGGAGVREGLMAAAAQFEGVLVGPVVLAAIAYRLALFVVTPVVWGVVRAVRAISPPR